MSNEEKQIEEMANITRVWCEIDNSCGSCHWETCNECLAECLYKAGYRKASDVVDEVIKIVSEKAEEESEYFDRMRVKGKDGRYFEGGKHTCEMLLLEFAELKERYESEGEK